MRRRPASRRRAPVRKHRAPKGALRPPRRAIRPGRPPSQKAPSAKRCIKTEGGLRLRRVRDDIRKHRAPKGALRRQRTRPFSSVFLKGQKAPSAKRCIKTKYHPDAARSSCSRVRKHQAPKGALRRSVGTVGGGCDDRSESTERQKVH